MSEESKTDGDYVMMGGGSVVPGRGKTGLNLDDPNLTQEEKDHRLAIALQQQENAAAYDEHKKKHDAYVAAQEHRTGRTGYYTKLAAVRSKDHGMLSVPSEYTSENAYRKEGEFSAPMSGPPKGATPQEIADWKLAAELQKVENVDAGTVQTMTKIAVEEAEEEAAQNHRTGLSNY